MGTLLQLVDAYGPAGGRERFVHDLGVRLRDAGHRVIVAAPALDAADWSRETAFEILAADPRDAGALARLAPSRVLWHAGPETARLAAALARRFPTTAVVHDPATCPMGTRLLRHGDRLCPHPGGWRCFSRWLPEGCGQPPSRRYAPPAIGRAGAVRRALAACEAIAVPSRALGDALALDGLPAARVRVYAPLLDARTPPPLAFAPGPGLRLLFAGRLVYEKGAHVLLDALALALGRGLDATLAIVGAGGHRSALEARLGALGLGERVRFEGRLPGHAMAARYAEADALVAPSLWLEAAGLVVAEARAQGRPSVVAASGGLPEWAEAFDGVLEAPRASAEGLASALLALGALKRRVEAGETTLEAALPRRARPPGAPEPADLVAMLTGTA